MATPNTIQSDNDRPLSPSSSSSSSSLSNLSSIHSSPTHFPSSRNTSPDFLFLNLISRPLPLAPSNTPNSQQLSPVDSPVPPTDEVPTACLISLGDDLAVVTDSATVTSTEDCTVWTTPIPIPSCSCSPSYYPHHPIASFASSPSYHPRQDHKHEWQRGGVVGGVSGGVGGEAKGISAEGKREGITNKCEERARSVESACVTSVSAQPQEPRVWSKSCHSVLSPPSGSLALFPCKSNEKDQVTSFGTTEGNSNGSTYHYTRRELGVSSDENKIEPSIVSNTDQQVKDRQTAKPETFILNPKSKVVMCVDRDVSGGGGKKDTRMASGTQESLGVSASGIRAMCSRTCSENFVCLARELGDAKDQLFALSVQMQEQASHITRLMEENRKYIKENGRLRNHSNQDDYRNLASEFYSESNDSTGLEDRMMALQLQNNELNLCLEREKRKRKEAEARLRRDEGYIKRLEDSVQALRGTRVVMDPSTYRQVAEAYMAARRTPTRRPHTHTGVPESDLVCDANQDPVMNNHRLSHPPLIERSSCPPSDSDSCPSTPEYPRLYSMLQPQETSSRYPEVLTRSRSAKVKKDRGHSSQNHGRGGIGVGGGSMHPWEYQQLLESLEDLDGASRGALS